MLSNAAVMPTIPVNSIATLSSERAAWFKDPEGNTLAVSQWL